jgi:DNA-binding GntR family transcriptional regulator
MGRLSPGDKLGEDQIAILFHTSRTVVREALHSLAHLGIVQPEANRGAFVASATAKEASDLYAARRVIETETIAQLARHCTANDIRALRQHLQAERAARKHENSAELIQIRSRFHLKMAELAGNRVLSDLLRQILPRTAMIATFYRYPRHTPKATDDHEELIRLLSAGDAESCVQLMREHLEFDEDNLRFPDRRPGTGRINLAAVLKEPVIRAKAERARDKKVTSCC